ncbi:ABC transporter ATP-binding protein [Patescibacteria group bacterium]|nr:ABC transporter ATP-binding protein [Patescibacteria group bacterium]
MPLIKLEGIRKIYNNGEDNRVVALDDVDLQIENGEFVAIMGPSGSGKSTLMHVLGFLDKADRGKYFFEGRNIVGLSDDDLASIRNEKVGFVFQAFNLLPRTSALDNVILPMLYGSKIAADKMRSRALQMLKQVDLESRANHHPSELSGGQQQRVAIARALINNPAVIFADEPTGNLDTKSSDEVMRIFKELNDNGRTLIFVTHEEEIAAYAKRIIRLKDGRIISDQLNGHRHHNLTS